MSTYSPAVSKSPSISRRLRPLSMTCVRPRERGLPSRVGTSRKECPSKACIDVLQLLARALLHVAIEGVAVGVDTDGERAEVLDPELPEALGHELFPGDLFDLLDLRRLERGCSADDREIDHPQSLHRLDRLIRQATFAADRTDAVLRAEALCEPHHARGGRGADADLFVPARAELADAGRRMEQKRAAEIHRRRDALVEDPDLRPVADADDMTVDGHLVAGTQLANRFFGRGEPQATRGHLTHPSNGRG